MGNMSNGGRESGQGTGAGMGKGETMELITISTLLLGLR